MTTYPTVSELRARFAEILAAIAEGRSDGCPTDTGLDDETMAALNEFAAAKAAKQDPRAITKALIAAETEFSKMIDGTHQRQHEAADREFFAQLAHGGPEVNPNG